MNNTSKQSVASATALQQNEFQWAALKLTLYYVLSTAVILAVSSTAVLLLFAPPEAHHEDEEVPLHDLVLHSESEAVHDFWSSYEFREHLPSVVMVVDVSILLLVSVVSYGFARHTLRPIKEVHERQAQFMSDVAHELRTPLSVMRSGAEVMLRREHTPAQYQEFVTDVVSETNRLTRLSNQLLTILRAGNTAATALVPHDFSALVTTEVTRFTHYAAEHKVTLTSSIAPHITLSIDRDGCVQLLQNLLKNAVDYNRPNGRVEVVLIQKGDQVELSVADTGVGIPLDKHDAVFARFTKLDAARQSGAPGGAGLGLAIVEEVVKRHGGTISLTSTPGVGTTITVGLPMTHS